MNPVPNLTPDSPRPPDNSARGPRRYTLGFTDGLGDRLLTFDNSTGVSLELLRFRPEFGDAPGFEATLRQRVEELSHLHHPALSVVRDVETVDTEVNSGLAVVSKLTPGRRLSDLVPKARGPAFALDLIRQLTPALATLQQAGPGIVHGALTVDRIVVAREGRLVVVEQVLGSALAILKLPAARLRSDLGLAVPNGADPIALDARLDVIQLGFIALSLLLGRRLVPSDYPANVNSLLDEFTKADSAGASAHSRLRKWLERTMQVGSRPFGSAQEAHEALSELPENVDAELSEPPRAVLAFPSEAPAAPASAPAPERKPEAVAKPADKTQAALKEILAAPPPPKNLTAAADAKAAPVARAPAPPPAPAPAEPKRKGGFTLGKLLVPVLATLVVAEGGVIAALYYSRPAPLVIEVAAPTPAARARAAVPPPPAVPDLRADAAAAGVTTAAAAVPGVPTPVPSKPAGDPTATPGPAEPPAPERPVAPGPRFGAVRISSPIELQVFEGGRLLGSTAAPIAINEGPHTVELVNESLGYRAQQTVTVRAGQMAGVTVALPNGRLSINAVPWAEVWIDGNAAGQTPIANFALTIGQHEILFRHPQFGEQRQTVVVKVDGLTRVSATLQR